MCYRKNQGKGEINTLEGRPLKGMFSTEAECKSVVQPYKKQHLSDPGEHRQVKMQ